MNKMERVIVMLEVGRVCVKNAGRDAGSFCVVIDIIDDNFVMITGPKSLTGARRKRCNIKHLEPTPYKVKINKDASDEEVLNAIKEAGIEDLMSKRIKIGV